MARRLPQLNALRAFEAAARHMSFTKAAAELHVTPAAVSHQVKGLEEQLGVELFRRLPRSLLLTDAGRILLPGLTDGFDRLARAAEEATGGGVSGRLTVSVLPSLASCWLVQRLHLFRARYPDIDIELLAEARPVDFTTEAVDIAIRYGQGNYPGMKTDLLMTEEVYPVCSPALLNGPRALRRLGDLRHHTLLHDSSIQVNEPWLAWEPWLKLAGLTDLDPNRGPRFSNTELVLQAAVAGHGVAIGRSALMNAEIFAGHLVRPVQASRRADFAYFVVAPTATADTPKVAAFRTWILEEGAAAMTETGGWDAAPPPRGAAGPG